VAPTTLFGELVLPEGRFDPAPADEIRRLAALAAAHAVNASGDSMRRAYRSAWRQYGLWCASRGVSPLSADPGGKPQRAAAHGRRVRLSRPPNDRLLASAGFVREGKGGPVITCESLACARRYERFAPSDGSGQSADHAI
jgi:hypothetical protein